MNIPAYYCYVSISGKLPELNGMCQLGEAMRGDNRLKSVRVVYRVEEHLALKLALYCYRWRYHVTASSKRGEKARRPLASLSTLPSKARCRRVESNLHSSHKKYIVESD